MVCWGRTLILIRLVMGNFILSTDNADYADCNPKQNALRKIEQIIAAVVQFIK
jgi:hypothetical protein